MTEHVIDELEDLLESERSALLGGDLDAVARSSGRKERLMRRIEPEVGLAGRLQQLGLLARRNAALLEAASSGLEAAAERLRALARPPTGLTTYDMGGRRQDLAGQAGEVVRRA